MRWRTLAGATLLALTSSTTMALDLHALWDYAHPALSEQRFAQALAAADDADERLILQTQIARTHGLRRDFERARQVLAAVEPQLPNASPEVRVRYALELGRSHASTAHPPEQLTPEATARARALFLQAAALAEQARLDFLAIDALHMMPVVDPAPARQIEWDERALAVLARSDQPDARRWEGALRNNLGYAKRLAGDFDGAVAQFRLSKQAYERDGRAANARIADWMIARTYREQRRYRDALAIQLALEKAWDAAGAPDPEVYEELAHLYRALGDDGEARRYQAKFDAASR